MWLELTWEMNVVDVSLSVIVKLLSKLVFPLGSIRKGGGRSRRSIHDQLHLENVNTIVPFHRSAMQVCLLKILRIPY